MAISQAIRDQGITQFLGKRFKQRITGKVFVFLGQGIGTGGLAAHHVAIYADADRLDAPFRVRPFEEFFGELAGQPHFEVLP